MNEYEYLDQISADIKNGKPISNPIPYNMEMMDLNGGVFLSKLVDPSDRSIVHCDLQNIIVEILNGVITNCQLANSWIKKSIIGLFENCNLTNCQANSVNIKDSDFYICVFDGSSFKSCKIANSFLSESRLEATDFSSCEINNVDLSRCNFLDTVFSNSKISNGNFAVSYFDNCDFDNSVIKILFSDSKFLHTSFKKADLSESELNTSHFINCSFEGANLKNCNITHCSFEDCNFERCILPDGKIGSHKTELGSNGQYHSKSLMSEREVRLLEEGEALEKEASSKKKVPEQLSLFPRKKDEVRQVPLEEVDRWLRDFDDGKLEIKEPRIRKAIENNRLSSMEQEFRIRKLKELLASLDTK